ncbi:MAG: hypothetical protein MJ188_09270 [Treponema sp.]|nr:hypothetical protein [Treponema sp.]
MKKNKLNAFIVTAGMLGMLFTACKNPTNDSPSKPGHTINDATKLIKFNLTDAQAIGSVFSDSTARSISRSAENETTNLLKYDEDGKASGVIEDAVEGQEIDYSTLQPILEIKKNPYSNIPEAAQGIYTLFNAKNDSIKYTDGKKAPSLGQLIYTKPDGTVVDVSVNDAIYTRGAESENKDYIEFANDGKAYFIKWYAANDNAGRSIWCFNPSSDEPAKLIDLGIKTKNEITDFRINDDGSWMFVATSEELNEINAGEEGIKHLYAVPTANPQNKIELYKQATDDRTVDIPNSLGRYGFSKITYDSTTKMMYVGCGGPVYLTNGKRFYKWANGYSASNVEFFETPYLYLLGDWYRFFKYYKNMSDDEVFEQMAKNFKNYCDLNHSDYNPAAGSSDDIEINLSYFADKPEYKDLYDADAKDGEAVKILFNNLLPNGVPENSYVWDNIIDGASTFYRFLYPYNQAGAFPVELLCFLKDSEGNATTETAYTQNPKLSEVTMIEEVVSLKNGCWGFRQGQKWTNNVTYDYLYSDFVQVTDANGKFICEVPEALKDIEGYYNFTSRNDGDPWFKYPYSINEDGLALISRDRKDIYYFDGETVTNLLEGKEIVDSIDYIYSVSLDKDILFFTAKGTDGNWINQEIRLSNETILELETTDLLSSIVGIESNL